MSALSATVLLVEASGNERIGLCASDIVLSAEEVCRAEGMNSVSLIQYGQTAVTVISRGRSSKRSALLYLYRNALDAAYTFRYGIGWKAAVEQISMIFAPLSIYGRQICVTSTAARQLRSII